ncbi:hypothetical protein AVEN_98303-1 [Araneus ventricosus]|uniref:Uncharacterized protein n=1 Tax=Araneus ventricosus TaxID=182803 RepID=A0A4Y2AYU4_ARAVE|nr:hypothetical protein AVEN_98303-1 [Araneus ventricosus]
MVSSGFSSVASVGASRIRGRMRKTQAEKGETSSRFKILSNSAEEEQDVEENVYFYLLSNYRLEWGLMRVHVPLRAISNQMSKRHESRTCARNWINPLTFELNVNKKVRGNAFCCYFSTVSCQGIVCSCV